jgi:hypothetical protein
MQLIIYNRIAVSKLFVLLQDMFDFILCHYEHSIGAFLTSFVIALRHPTKVIFKCSLPYFGCHRIVHHFFATGDGLTGHWVYHW